MRSVWQESFDAVVAYGGPLSYVFERLPRALAEVLRVLKPHGLFLTSAMCLWYGVVGREMALLLLEFGLVLLC